MPAQPTDELVQVAALVPATMANDLRSLAASSERSMAAEIRLALRSWIESQQAAA